MSEPSAVPRLILAPLRGVTIRTFREVFASQLAAAGFTEAITPFIPAMPGLDPLKDRELAPHTSHTSHTSHTLHLSPQFIGKDPAALREALKRIRGAGYETADLNGGCPFPMVRNKGRGSGLLRTPDTLRRMLEAGCETMGEGNFSLKVRLGVERNDELKALMPIVNEFPLRFLTVHARNAKQMYEGECDRAAFDEIAHLAKVPVIYNGDAELPEAVARPGEPLMIGRAFVRSLGAADDAEESLNRYIDASAKELCGDRPVLGRMKELIAYWKELPKWRRRWNVLKLTRTVSELRSVIG